MKQVILIMGLSTLAFGCAGEVGKKSEEVPTKVETPTVETEKLSSTEVFAEVVGATQPNQYNIIFHWKRFNGKIQISDGSTKLKTFDANSEDSFQILRPSGHDLIFSVEQLDMKDKVLSTFPLVVKIPTDIVIEGTLVLSNSVQWRANRVFVKNSAVVYFEDKSINISADEFISENGTFQSYSNPANPRFEKNGRSGGSVTITARSARGNLKVNLLGESGGHGKNGQNLFPGRHPGCAGTSGGDGGNSGDLTVTLNESSQFNLDYTKVPGPLGPAGIRGGALNDNPNETVAPPCDRDNPNGIDGKTGGEGQVCLKLTSEGDYVCK